MIKAIHSGKKAMRDFNKKVLAFADIEAGMQRQLERKNMPKEEEIGLDHALVAQGLPVQYSVKRALAKSFGIDYTGTKEQDSILMAGLQGRIIKEEAEKNSKGEQEKAEREHSYKEKEHGLKEREISLKEQETENNKPASAKEIASEILKNYKE